METMEANVGKMEVQFKKWGAKLDELVAKAEYAGAEAKVDYRKRIDMIKAKHEAAGAKLEELKNAGKDRWETLKDGVEKASKDLEDAFKKLTN